MKTFFFILTILCFSGASALQCHDIGPVDFSDKDANQEVLEFFDILSNEFSGRDASFDELVSRFERAQMNSPKANDLLCAFASDVG
jgi:hypothetical protein